MNSNKYKWLGQLLATLGVVISLSLVAFELKQGREVAMAQIYQERTAIVSNQILETMGIEAFQQARNNRFAKRPLSELEQWLLDDDQLLSLLYFDNTHYQYTLGLIPEEEWLVVLDAVKNEARHIVDDGHLLAGWEESKFGFRASFADIVSAEIAGYKNSRKTPAPQTD